MKSRSLLIGIFGLIMSTAGLSYAGASVKNATPGDPVRIWSSPATAGIASEWIGFYSAENPEPAVSIKAVPEIRPEIIQTSGTIGIINGRELKEGMITAGWKITSRAGCYRARNEYSKSLQGGN